MKVTTLVVSLSASFLMLGCQKQTPRLATYKQDSSRTITFSFSNGSTCAYIEPILVGPNSRPMWRVVSLGALAYKNEVIYLDTRQDALTLTENMLCPTKLPPSDGRNPSDGWVVQIPATDR